MSKKKSLKTKKKSKKAMMPIHGPDGQIERLKEVVKELEKRIQRLEVNEKFSSRGIII